MPLNWNGDTVKHVSVGEDNVKKVLLSDDVVFNAEKIVEKNFTQIGAGGGGQGVTKGLTTDGDVYVYTGNAWDDNIAGRMSVDTTGYDTLIIENLFLAKNGWGGSDGGLGVSTNAWGYSSQNIRDYILNGTGEGCVAHKSTNDSTGTEDMIVDVSECTTVYITIFVWAVSGSCGCECKITDRLILN